MADSTTAGIYGVFCTATKTCLIGSSQNIPTFLRQLKYRLNQGSKQGTIQNEWLKFKDSFSFEQLSQDPSEQEKYYQIKAYSKFWTFYDRVIEEQFYCPDNLKPAISKLIKHMEDGIITEDQLQTFFDQVQQSRY